MQRRSHRAWRRLQRGEWRLFSPPPRPLPKIQLHALVIEASRASINPRARQGNDTRHRTDTALLLARLEALQFGRDLLHRGIADERHVNSPRSGEWRRTGAGPKSSGAQFDVIAGARRSLGSNFLILA